MLQRRRESSLKKKKSFTGDKVGGVGGQIVGNKKGIPRKFKADRR